MSTPINRIMLYPKPPECGTQPVFSKLGAWTHSLREDKIDLGLEQYRRQGCTPQVHGSGWVEFIYTAVWVDVGKEDYHPMTRPFQVRTTLN